MLLLPPGIRAVFFDAVGTLLHPEPAAADVYYQVGQRHGSRLTLDEIRRRFGTAFRAEEKRDALAGHRTSEQREVRRWHDIVAAVLDDLTNPQACFQELYDHFARPEVWRCEPGTGEVLAALCQAGYIVGMASNFDHRLRSVAAKMPDLAGLHHLAISSEIGWKKPALEFFAALSAMTGIPADQIVMIGDDRENDIEGARRAGLHAVLIDPQAGGLAALLGG